MQQLPFFQAGQLQAEVQALVRLFWPQVLLLEVQPVQALMLSAAWPQAPELELVLVQQSVVSQELHQESSVSAVIRPLQEAASWLLLAALAAFQPVAPGA
jgi:hypothetical protein